MSTRLIILEREGRIRVSLRGEDMIADEPFGNDLAFEPVFTGQELEDLRWYLEDYLPAPYAVWEERGAKIEEKLKEWGERIFRWIFADERRMGAYWRARAERDYGREVEIWISSNSPAFLGLPWELMRDPDHPTPLALEIARMGRTIPVPAGAAIHRPDERLRILMVIARPYGEKDVPYQMIARPLMDCLELVSDRVELKVLRPPTIEALRRELQRAREAGEPYQVLHFDGHGNFEAPPADGSRPGGAAGTLPPQAVSQWYGSARGYLLFESADGKGAPLGADDFALLLKQSDIPLLALNACRSASLHPDFGPEATVAARLLQEGAASVVAMSYSIYAEAAAQFMALFYDALFSGRSVSEAVAEGRRAMHRSSLRPSPKGKMPLQDWIVPVLYGRKKISFPYLKKDARSARRAVPLEEAFARMRDEEHSRHSGADRLMGGICERDPLEAEGRFFGRDAEFYELERALPRSRVVIVHGVGGCGKTELAKGYARWLRRSGGLDDPKLAHFYSFEPGLASFNLNGAITSLGMSLFGPDFVRELTEPEQRQRTILGVMSEYRMLLVWDNFETVHSMPDPNGATPPLGEEEIEAFRSFLGQVMKDTRSAVLITSRSPEEWLGKKAHRLALEGLRHEDASAYADWLLSSRPRARKHRSHRAYGDLLSYLGGHPLSLRLILPCLEESSAASLLEGLKGMGAPPPGFEGGEGRLESLGACIRYSFRCLSVEQCRLLPALALFEGVADADVLTILSGSNDTPSRFRGADKRAWTETLDMCGNAGLVTSLGASIYGLHPALPAYLVAFWKEQAGASFEDEYRAALRESIRAHAMLGSWLRQQMGSGSAETAMAVLALERGTLGRVLREAMELGMFSEAQDIFQPLDDFWDARGLTEEAQGWTNRLRLTLEDNTGSPPDLDTEKGALWLFIAGSEANRLLEAGKLDLAQSVYNTIREALEKSGSESAHRHLATAYHQLGMVAQQRGDLESAQDWYLKSLEIKEALGNRPGMASSYHQLGRVAQDRGDLESAQDWYLKSLEIKEALGNRPGMASSYHQLGIVAQQRGDLESAQDWYLKSLEIEEALGNRPGMALSYHQLGIVAQLRGDLVSAQDWYLKSLEIKEALGNRPGKALSYAQLGLLTEQQGNSEDALNWMIRCVSLFPEFPHPMTGTGPRHLARLTAQLGMQALEKLWLHSTGKPLPENVRRGVEQMIASGSG